jgi:hypothetical protein
VSEYHKIETLYERDEQTFRLKPELVLKNRTYSLIKTWNWTEKIDGTNIRCIWDHITGKVTFGSKSDNAQIHADLVRYLYENIPVENVRGVFPDVSAVLYGEGYGAGIQKGGDYSDKKKFILFDVLVDGKWWLSWENTCDVATKLHLETVPYLGEMTLEDATTMVRAGFQSKLNGGKMKAEGLVGRTAEPLFDKKGARLIVKLKTKDF